MMSSGVEIILKDLDKNDIESVLKAYNDLKNIKYDIDKNISRLDGHLYKYLKDRKWERYNSTKHKISVSLTKDSKEKVNKKALSLLLNEEQYKQIITKKKEEKLMVVNKKDRERLNKYVNNK